MFTIKKETIPIIIIGHVDHGKSTLIGRLLFETDSLPEGRILEIKKISRELGKDAELAFLTDQLKEEREQNRTIDTTQIFFRTKHKNFIIIDTPGHVEFIKNMLTGATLAKAAILLIDVNEGIKEQTVRHLNLIKMLGINNLVIVFNKMDLVNYKKEKFGERKDELDKFLNTIEVKPLYIVPVSAKEGINITKRTLSMNWYDGPTLLEAINSLKLGHQSNRLPLRFAVQDAYGIGGKQVIVGKVASGVISRGQKITILPRCQEMKVASIVVFGKSHKVKACQGENIGLILDSVASLSCIPAIKRGDIVSGKENVPKLVQSIKGSVFWLSEENLKPNRTLTLRCATQETECFLEEILEITDSSTLTVIDKDSQELKMNEIGKAIFRIKEPIVVENHNFVEEFGRFVIEDGSRLQGVGIIV